MASKGIGVPFVAEVGPFLKGTAQLEDALGDVGHALDDLQGDAARDTRRMIEGFDQLAREGDQSADKLERSFGDAFDQLPKDAKAGARKAAKAVDDLGDDVHTKGKGKFADIGSDIGGELAQNIGEGVSSGSGDLVGTVLGTLGGILPALGPLAAVAGIGALAVSSIMGGMSEAAKAQQAKLKEIGASMFDALQDGILDQQEKNDIVTKVLGADDLGDALAKLRKQSADTGIPVKALFEAYATGTSEVTKQLDEVINAHTTLDGISSHEGVLTAGRLDDTAKAAQAVKDQLRDASGAAKDAYANISTLAQVTGKAADEAGRYITNLAKARRAAGILPGQSQGRRNTP